MRRNWAFLIPAAIVGMLLFAFIGGEVVKELWNWLLPPLFGWHAINFWQAIGLLALCRILFGGFRPSGSVGPRWRHRMKERWGHMSPEDRERFRQGVRSHFGFDPPAGEGGVATPGAGE